MDVEINNVIYMELNSGPKIVNSTCGKTINVETIDRDSTVQVNPLTPELNPSQQCCLLEFFAGAFKF